MEDINVTIKKLDIQNNDVIIFKGDYGCIDIEAIASKLQDMDYKNLIICLNEDTDITTLPEKELKALLEALEKKRCDEKEA